MKKNAQSVLKNLYYTIVANFATLGISVLLNLFVPKLLGVTEYSYWQLYVFYSSYVGFLHFGWIDGIYLKIGGEEYDNLNKKSLGTQFWYLIIFELILSIFVIIWALIFMPRNNQSLILILTAIVSVITIMKTYVLYIFQSTNRIKEYAQLSRNDRYLYILLIGIYFATGGRSFYWLIIMDILSKLIFTVWGVFKIQDMIAQKWEPLKNIYSEILDNINIGSKLMLSNIASMLILGTIRFFVQHKWSIETFGKLSFTLSISNMFLTFVNAVGVVMFPLLRRTDKAKLPKLFTNLRNVFVPLTYGILLFYIPAKLILGSWLPEYSDSLMYMGILFPMVVYEGRMSLLVNTYLKSMRKEKTILMVNIVTLVVTLLLSIITVYIIQNLILSVCLIIFSLALRCLLAEYFLCRSMGLDFDYQSILETILTVLFVVSNLIFNDSLISFIIYGICYIIYVLIMHRVIISNCKELMNLIKEN